MVKKECRGQGNKLMLIVRSFIFMATLSAIIQGAMAEDGVYNKIGIVRGQVFIINNPELGRVPALGQYFVFQRMDCHQCLIGIRTDVEGRYTVFLGVGKYQLICTEPTGDKADLIRKGQNRELIVTPRPNDTKFDIELEIPDP